MTEKTTDGDGEGAAMSSTKLATPSPRVKRPKGVAPSERPRPKPPTDSLPGDELVSVEHAERNAALVGGPPTADAGDRSDDDEPAASTNEQAVADAEAAATLDYEPPDEPTGDDAPPTNGQARAKLDLAAFTPDDLARWAGNTAKRQGDEWLTRCPDRAHADRNPSARLKVTASGCVWHCDSQHCETKHGGGGVLGWVRALNGHTTNDEAMAWLRDLAVVRTHQPASTRPTKRQPAKAALRAAAAWAKRTDLTQHWAGERLAEKLREGDELLAATAATMGLTAERARAYGMRPAVVRTGNVPRLVVSLPAYDYEGVVVNWKDWPHPTARGSERRPGKGYDGVVGYGREQLGEAADAVVLAEGESDGLTVRGVLDDAAADLTGRWVAVGAQGAGKGPAFARDLAEHCQLAGLPMPTLLLAFDCDETGRRKAAAAVAAWQRAGGAACAVSLPEKHRNDPDAVDLRRLLTGDDHDARAKVLAALSAAAQRASTQAAATVRYDDPDRPDKTLADLIEAAQANEAKADDLAAMNAQADQLLKAQDRRRAEHAATRQLGDAADLLAYNPHGGLWFRWADGLGGWRATSAAAMALRAEREIAAAAMTDPAAVDDKAVREVLKRAERRLGPPQHALDAREAYLVSGKATQLWNRKTGAPVDGVLLADGVLTLNYERGKPVARCADALAVAPVTPDLMPDLPPLPASVEGLLDLASRVAEPADLLTEAATLAPRFHAVLTGYGLPDAHLTWLLAQMGRTLLAVVGERPGLMLLVGPPGTGKGLLLTLLGELAGSQFTLPNGWADLAGQFGPNDLLGKRVTLSFDSPATLTSSDAKRGLGVGKQVVVGEPMRCETKFDPTTKTRRLLTTCWQAANELPSYPSLGEAKAWLKRTAYLRLARQVPDDDQDPDLPATLAELEGAAITHLVICAWVLKVTGSLVEPADLAAERQAQLMSRQKLVERAVEAVAVVDASGRYGNKELTAAVDRWADDEGLDDDDKRGLTSGAIANAAVSFGAVKVVGERDRARGQMYVGLRLLDAPLDDAGGEPMLAAPTNDLLDDAPMADERTNRLTDEQLAAAKADADNWLE